jgi:hypothetical protein
MLPRVSTLVLDTADLSSVDNPNNNKEFVFRNVDFDRLIGEEWREFDQFNLMLVSTVFDIHGSTPTTVVPEVRLSGPPFVDPDTRGTRIFDDITVCTVDVTNIQNAPFIEYYSGMNAWTLKRDDENLFNFHFRIVNPDTGVLATGSFPRQQYVFKIYKV